MTQNRITVAIDGPAGSGKSSVSKLVAAEMGLKYIDSGAVYRAITYYTLLKNQTIDKDVDFTSFFDGVEITQHFNNNGTSETFIDGEDVSMKIRDESVTKVIGSVSDRRDVRDYVNSLLRHWALDDSVIMDGRDIGTVVFPDADLKIYLDASVDIRAFRRMKEYKEMGKNVDEKSIKKQIIRRDEEDQLRPFGALVKADDAICIDTSKMTRSEVVSRVKELVMKISSCSRV